MDVAKMLQIPPSFKGCVYLSRSYMYIDKYNGVVYIREISPFFAPGFIMGVCGQIPFLHDMVQPYLNDVGWGNIYEVAISDQYKNEMERNAYVNANADDASTCLYTPTDCDFVLSVVLNAITFSMYGHFNRDFEDHVNESVQNISTMANIYPMTFMFPQSFRHTMKTTLESVPNLRLRMMSLLCQNNYYQHGNVWSLIKRYIWTQLRYYHMGTFMAIGQWYEAREKTCAHVDTEIVAEMKRYQIVKNQMKAIVDEQGYSIGTFRILNPQSMLPYLRQYANSAYCAIEWKKKIDSRWDNRQYDWNRFGIDTKSLDRMMSIPVKHTLKRPLNDKEIEQIASKRFKELETDFTADDFFTENCAGMIPKEE